MQASKSMTETMRRRIEMEMIISKRGCKDCY